MEKRIRSNYEHLMQRPLIDINLWVIEKWRSEELKRGKAKPLRLQADALLPFYSYGDP